MRPLGTISARTGALAISLVKEMLSAAFRIMNTTVRQAWVWSGLHQSQSFLGDYFPRMKARIGTPKAMTDAPHKLAGIVYRSSPNNRNMTRPSFRTQERKRAKLDARAKELVLQLIPVESVP
jgi:hypothetical protein